MSAMHAGVMTTSTEMMYAEHVTLTEVPSHRRSAFTSISQELTRHENRKSGTSVTAKSPTVKCPMIRPQRYSRSTRRSHSATAVAAVSERVVRVYRTTHAVPLVAHARKLHTCASTHTQCKRKSQHSHTAEATIAQRLLASAAADRTTIIAAARSSGGGVAAGWPATTEPPIVRFMTPCLGGCALTYASARGVHTQNKVNESLNART